MRYSDHFCTLRAELQADAAPMVWFTDSKTPRLLNSLHRGREVQLKWLEGLLYHTPGTFSQQTLLEVLIVTGGSASYFGTAVQQYIQYTMVAGIAVGNPDVVRLPASSRSTGRRQVGSHERFSEHVENDGHLNKQL